MKDGDEGFVHMALVDPFSREFHDITFYKIDEEFEISRVTSVEQAIPVDDKWEMRNIKIHDLKPRPELVATFETSTVESKLFSDLADLPVNKPKFLSLGELAKIIKVLKQQKLNTAAYELMIYKSYSHAISSVIIMFLVFPLCINFSRHSSYIISAVNSLMFALAYWISVGSFQSLGKTGVMSPLTVSIVPNVAFFLLALFLIYRKESAG
jgi:lipopolysaccharide export system permease protein